MLQWLLIQILKQISDGFSQYSCCINCANPYHRALFLSLETELEFLTLELPTGVSDGYN